MYLRDRRRRHRLAEFGEQIVRRTIEGARDFLACNLSRKRRKVVLQGFKRRRDLGADEIGPRRQHLSELDIRRPEILERKREARTRRAFAIGLASAEEEPRDLQGCRHPRIVFMRDQRIVTRKHARRAQKPPQIGKRLKHQIRQAECMAAMPPVKLRTFTRDNPAFSIIVANGFCAGKRRMLSAR